MSWLPALYLMSIDGDHSKAAKDLINAGIDVYMSRGTKEILQIPDMYELKVIKSKEQIMIGTWTIKPFDTRHDAEEPLGFILANKAGDKLLFATDTFYLKYKVKGLTHIMIECNYAKEILDKNTHNSDISIRQKLRVLKSHMSLETLLDTLQANDLSRVREIHLLHLSDDNSNAELFKKEVQKISGKPTFIAG